MREPYAVYEQPTACEETARGLRRPPPPCRECASVATIRRWDVTPAPTALERMKEMVR